MDLKLLAILVLSAACTPSHGKPGPDPETIVQISQEVNGGGCGGGGCGGGCCDQQKGCPFEGVVYPNKALIEHSCLELRCRDGEWECTGKVDKDCGECSVHGHENITTFDGVNYTTNLTGEFALSQFGFGYGALYGVNVALSNCFIMGGIETCVSAITYHEPG
ncbi:unnamed protein product, partial [Meganyctiphanes norvegica]